MLRGLTLVPAIMVVMVPAVKADSALPVIVTYELAKHRSDVRMMRHDPKAFWIRQVAARVEDEKRALPTPLKATVTVKVDFVVARDGHLVSKAVRASSGVAMVDEAAIKMLDDAQPFPPMPAGLSDPEVSFTLPVRFR